MEKIISGIYGIEDIQTGDIYVGSADSENGIKKRWSCHAAHLKNNRHSYEELQKAFNNNKNRIKWIILEECPDEELEERENYWIDYCDKVDGWHVINKEKKSKKRTKVKDTSNMKVAQQGENNGNCCKLTVEDVVEIKKMLKDGVRQSAIARKYNVSTTLIWNIANCNRWASVNIEKEAESTAIDTTSTLCTSAKVHK